MRWGLGEGGQMANGVALHLPLPCALDKLISPLGSFTSDGSFRWSHAVWTEIQKLELTKYLSVCEEGGDGEGVAGGSSGGS